MATVEHPITEADPTLNDVIAQLRLRRKMPLRALAALYPTAASTLSGWLLGISPAPSGLLPRLAELLGVDVATLPPPPTVYRAPRRRARSK